MSANVHTVITDSRCRASTAWAAQRSCRRYRTFGRDDHRARLGRERRRGGQAGAFDYLEKPFEQEQIRQIVSKR